MLGKEMGYEISTCQMQYDANNKETDQKDPCFIYSGGNGPRNDHGFDPGPRHTKVVKNGTSCSSLGTQTYGVELGLVDPVSG